MQRHPLGFVFLLAGLAAPLAGPLAARAQVLVVLNKSDHTAALVNPATYEVLAKLPTGRGPHEAAASPDGRFAYVSNYGVYGVFPARPAGGRQGPEGSGPRQEPGNSITVLDLEQRAVRTTFNLGDCTRPHGLWTSRDASRLWVTCESAQAVLELDAGTGLVLKSWKTNQDTSHMVVATPDERKLYVANIGSGSVTVIERATDTVTNIPTGAGAEGLDIAPNGRELWVGNRGANTLSVIDVAADRVLATFESGGETPIRVKFTPDGAQVWVSNARSNTVTVFDAASRQLLATIEVGAVPVGLLFAADGQRAFVASSNANQVAVLDVPGRKILKTFTTGTEPDGMALARKPQ